VLFFQKSKPYLKDLIPNNFIDIHSHLLFGIDDGAKTFEDSLSLTKALIDIGFSEFITTPHTMQYLWNNTAENILNRNNETIALLQQNSISVPFKAASEYLIDENFANQFQNEPLLTLKENYVLVEMSYINPPIQLYNIIFDLQVCGYKPILAHPERYVFYHDNFSEYEKLKKAGCLFQINLLSTVGYYGANVTTLCNKLLEKGMFDFVGSDVHHKNHVKAFDTRINIKNSALLNEIIANNKFFKF